MPERLWEVLRTHGARYPRMRPRDAVKLIYQNEFGGGHLVKDRERSLERIRAECGAALPVPEPVEDIGNGLVRVHLSALEGEKLTPEGLNGAFVRSAELHRGDMAAFLEKLEVLRELCGQGVWRFSPGELEEYLTGYLAAGCPMVSHSEEYRGAYRPAYRVLLRSCLEQLRREEAVVRQIDRLRPQGGTLLVAIDGRCAAGKSTLAECLRERLGCPVVHMDHFFLRPEQRTAERYAEPGGNVDRERFAAEVLRPLREGRPAVYRPFDCRSQSLTEPVRIPAAPVVVVEGSYSCHPELAGYCGLKIFLSVSPGEQTRRVIAREGPEAARTFRERWIPLEERYFAAFGIAEGCELCFDGTGLKNPPSL